MRAHTDLRNGRLAASAISLFEILAAIRRRRLVLAVPPEQWLSDIRLLPERRFEAVSAEIAGVAGSFSEAVPGDPADRIIAATAIALDLKLVTADERLRRVPHLHTIR